MLKKFRKSHPVPSKMASRNISVRISNPRSRSKIVTVNKSQNSHARPPPLDKRIVSSPLRDGGLKNWNNLSEKLKIRILNSLPLDDLKSMSLVSKNLNSVTCPIFEKKHFIIITSRLKQWDKTLFGKFLRKKYENVRFTTDYMSDVYAFDNNIIDILEFLQKLKFPLRIIEMETESVKHLSKISTMFPNVKKIGFLYNDDIISNYVEGAEKVFTEKKYKALKAEFNFSESMKKLKRFPHLQDLTIRLNTSRPEVVGINNNIELPNLKKLKLVQELRGKTKFSPIYLPKFTNFYGLEKLTHLELDVDSTTIEWDKLAVFIIENSKETLKVLGVRGHILENVPLQLDLREINLNRMENVDIMLNYQINLEVASLESVEISKQLVKLLHSNEKLTSLTLIECPFKCSRNAQKLKRLFSRLSFLKYQPYSLDINTRHELAFVLKNINNVQTFEFIFPKYIDNEKEVLLEGLQEMVSTNVKVLKIHNIAPLYIEYLKYFCWMYPAVQRLYFDPKFYMTWNIFDKISKLKNLQELQFGLDIFSNGAKDIIMYLKDDKMKNLVKVRVKIKSENFMDYAEILKFLKLHLGDLLVEDYGKNNKDCSFLYSCFTLEMFYHRNGKISSRFF